MGLNILDLISWCRGGLRISAKGESFYYEENNRLDILFENERASSFSQEAWKLSQNTTSPSDWLMSNGQPNSEGQSLLDNTMPYKPEAEEKIVEQASNFADVMKSPKVVYLENNLPEIKSEEVITIEDSDEEDYKSIISIGDSSDEYEDKSEDDSESEEYELEEAESEDFESDDAISGTSGPVDVNMYVIYLGQNNIKLRKNSRGRYKCPEISCYFSRTDRNIVRRHYHVHTKPFQCKLCDKTFSSKGNCIMHIRTHDDSFKLKCAKCEAKFAQNFVLKNHMMRFHND